MSANLLLLWMSARCQGSWQQFRGAVEELHLDENGIGQEEKEEDRTDQSALPLYQTLRLNLQRLGHAEFFTGAAGSDWRVTPPSLALTQHPRGCLGILAGARTDELMRKLHEASTTQELEILRFPSCPDQIRIIAKEACQLVDIAEQVGLSPQINAPIAILTVLPPIDDLAVRRQIDLPFGADWKIEQFSTSSLGWKGATRDEALYTSEGLFRFSLPHQHLVLFCSKGSAFQVPGQVGKYLVLRRRRKIFHYDITNNCLSIPASCRPPFLVERALILCSGLLPSYESRGTTTGILHYPEVPRAVAQLASALLRQELQ